MHEQAVLDLLSKRYTVHTATSTEHTQQLMRDEVDVIYQAQLMNAFQ